MKLGVVDSGTADRVELERFLLKCLLDFGRFRSPVHAQHLPIVLLLKELEELIDFLARSIASRQSTTVCQ